MGNRSTCRRFLESHGMWHGGIPFDGLVSDILGEIERGLSGEPSSLAMIPTYLRPIESIPPGQPVLAIDAGGTNFRAALVSFGPRGAEIDGFRSKRMPGIEREASRREFFDELASHIEDLAPRASRIGFCFSYPILITPDLDGKLLHFTKEIRAPEVEGSMVGAGLMEALARAGMKGKQRIVLLNDTTATLLAGQSAAADRRQYDSYVGYILGTGTNTAYVETSIPKLPAPGEQIVVLESGGFAVRYRGDLDEEFDRTTLDPGVYPYEKMHSGAYLGGVALTVLRRAARDGLIGLGAIDRLSARDLAEFLERPFDGGTVLGRALAGEAVERAYLLVDALVERAALLAAAVLTAAVARSGKGTMASRPVCIAVDGTMWREMPRLASRADVILERGLGERERSARTVTPANATLLGAAVAGLSA